MSQGSPKPIAAHSSLRGAFPGYFPPSETDLEAFYTKGLVVLDTNTLLDAYKLTGTARTEFLNALRAVGERLFIPYQVGVEFMRQRPTVIKAGNAFPSKFREAAKKLHAEVQTLKEHRRLQDDEIADIKTEIDTAIEKILKRHTALYDFGVTLDKNIEHDPVFAEIQKITEGKLGPPFDKPDEVAKRGDQRMKNKIPPGYADYAKEPQKALGDFFLWEQTLLEATERQLPVLIVSNDGKEDWVRKEDSYDRGPRPELVDEMFTKSHQRFHLVNVKTFLTHAKAYLRAEVSDATIEQAESVQESGQDPSFAENRLVYALLREGVPVGDLIRELSVEERAALRRALNLRTHDHNAPFGERAVEQVILGGASRQESSRWFERAVEALQAGGEVRLVSSARSDSEGPENDESSETP